MPRTPSRSGRGQAASTPPPAPVEIFRVGADGDGVAALPDGTPIYLQDRLPGEQVLAHPVTRRGEGWAGGSELLRASPDRAVPPCPHFGCDGDNCGGCTLQHWADAPYADWKIAQVTDALHRAGVVAPSVHPLRRTAPGGRRRMDLALRRHGGAVQIGLHARRSTGIVDMRTCLVLHPTLFALIQALRPVLASLSALRREGSAEVNLLDSGPDLLLRTDSNLTIADRSTLTAFARANRVPRVAWSRGNALPEPVCILRPPTTMLGGIAVEPPSGGFLQASLQGEAAIIDAVLAALPQPMPARALIVELFAGCGTLTTALAGRARVAAYEGNPASLTALRKAGIPRVSAEGRDLAQQPLQQAALRGATAVVLDPPWGGAASQMPAIAASGVPLVCYVSCNPAALTRDARQLIQAGYVLRDVTPIDQFLWSAQVECVCSFVRPSKR